MPKGREHSVRAKSIRRSARRHPESPGSDAPLVPPCSPLRNGKRPGRRRSLPVRLSNHSIGYGLPGLNRGDCCDGAIVRARAIKAAGRGYRCPAAPLQASDAGGGGDHFESFARLPEAPLVYIVQPDRSATTDRCAERAGRQAGDRRRRCRGWLGNPASSQHHRLD